MDLKIGDTVRMKKPHPCGSTEWKILRVGADLRLECLGCGKTILIPRYEFAKKCIKKIG